MPLEVGLALEPLAAVGAAEWSLAGLWGLHERSLVFGKRKAVLFPQMFVEVMFVFPTSVAQGACVRVLSGEVSGHREMVQFHMVPQMQVQLRFFCKLLLTN